VRAEGKAKRQNDYSAANPAYHGRMFMIDSLRVNSKDLRQ
jgi:hypothetical protein